MVWTCRYHRCQRVFFFFFFFLIYTRVRIFHSTETVRLFRLFKRPRYVHSQVSKVKLVCWRTRSCHFKSNNMDKTIIQILHLSWNRVYFENFETIIINMKNINSRTMPTSTKPGSSSMYHWQWSMDSDSELCRRYRQCKNHSWSISLRDKKCLKMLMNVILIYWKIN